jgi:hypothetical protein
LTDYLPFNRESLTGLFVPGKNGEPPEDRGGTWLLVQENALWVHEASGERGWRLPQGPLPADFARTLDPIVHLGTYRGAPCWAAAVPSGVEVPAGLKRESLLPAQTRLTEDALSLGGRGAEDGGQRAGGESEKRGNGDTETRRRGDKGTGRRRRYAMRAVSTCVAWVEGCCAFMAVSVVTRPPARPA